MINSSLDCHPLEIKDGYFALIGRLLSEKDGILENILVYRFWMAPFAQLKLRPVLSNHDLTKVRRVRDIGCGPGTNTRHFLSCDYLGIDFFNEEIQSPAPSGGCTSPTAS
jgi:SAM-dependent methyltransferase